MYVLTGVWPEDDKDYFFPKTGGKNPDGTDERLTLPTYAKDWFAYGTQPIKTVTHKAHPLWGIIGDLAKNKDFFNVEISKSDDPIINQMYDKAKHVVKNSRSISWQNYERMNKAEPDAHWKNVAISITGITTAPGYITKSPAQKLMTRYIVNKIPRGSKTTEKFERSQYRKTIKNILRKGGQIDKKEVIEMLGKKGYNKIVKESKLHPFEELFKRLRFQEALNVYIVANEMERELVKNILVDKERRSRTKTEEEIEIFNDLNLTKGAKTLRVRSLIK